MKHLVLLISIMALVSCNEKTVPNTDIDVARAFIKDILDNNFTEAETFVLKDSANTRDDANMQFFNLFKKEYESKSKEELENYRKADIIINEISNVSDSVSIVNYSNSFRKDKSSKLKMVRINGRWLVDLKYTFSGNM
jgi:hypothetical protein